MRAELSVSTTIQTVSASDRRGSAGWERSEPEDDDQSAWAREEQQVRLRSSIQLCVPISSCDGADDNSATG
jgi:hypothetical protein